MVERFECHRRPVEEHSYEYLVDYMQALKDKYAKEDKTSGSSGSKKAKKVSFEKYKKED